jgi:hypothetical protein
VIDAQRIAKAGNRSDPSPRVRVCEWLGKLETEEQILNSFSDDTKLCRIAPLSGYPFNSRLSFTLASAGLIDFRAS